MSSENYRLLHIILILLVWEIHFISGKSVSKEYPEPFGDIVLQQAYNSELHHGSKLIRNRRQIINPDRFNNKLWSLPIKYKLDPLFDQKSAKDIQDAMNHWEKDTCLKFEKLPTGGMVFVFHLLISKSDICSSGVGRSLTPVQLMRLNPAECKPFFGYALHQFGHVLGFVHEQNRADSREYISINKKSFKSSSYQPLFNVWPNPTAISTFDVPYDHGSVMHYAANQHAKPGKLTMEAIDPLFQKAMGQRSGLSFYDTKVVNLAYCKDVCDRKLDCKKGGITNPTNCNVCICPDGYGGTLCEKVGPSDSNCSPNSNTIIRVLSSKETCLESPRYGSGVYDVGSQCNWILQAPEGRQIQLRFSGDFGIYIYDDVSCFHWVEIKYKGNLEGMGPRFCGLEKPNEVLTSEGNQVVISFRSNYAAPESSRKGFRLCYKLNSMSETTSGSDSSESGSNSGSDKSGSDKEDTKGDESLSDSDNIQIQESCMGGFIFSANASACPATCASPNKAKKCKKPSKPGCTCPEKQFLFNGVCVPKKKCKCLDNNGVVRKKGEFWLSTNCKERTICQKRGKLVIKKKLKCLPNQKCVVENGHGKCVNS